MLWISIPAGQDTAERIEFFGDEVERITQIDADG